MNRHVIANARTVLRDMVIDGTAVIEAGRIAEVQLGAGPADGADDFAGDYLLPGLVELHTDNLERHLTPRPGVR